MLSWIKGKVNNALSWCQQLWVWFTALMTSWNELLSRVTEILGSNLFFLIIRVVENEPCLGSIHVGRRELGTGHLDPEARASAEVVVLHELSMMCWRGALDRELLSLNNSRESKPRGLGSDGLGFQSSKSSAWLSCTLAACFRWVTASLLSVVSNKWKD